MTDIIVEVTGAGGATNLQALTDVDTSGAANSQVLAYNSSTLKWEPSSVAGVDSLGALNGVDLTGNVTGKYLQFDGTNFVPVDAPTGGVTSYNNLTDVPATFAPSAHTHTKVEITDFSDADYATAAQGTLAATALQSGANISLLTNDSAYLTSLSLDGLTNVNTTGATTGQVLKFNGTTWFAGDDIAETGGGATVSYLNLTDVPATFAPSAHTHVTADITDLSIYTGFDARYFTEAETTSLVNAKANTVHTHVTTDITDLASYTGLDVRYYTETEMDGFLTAKANAVHTHLKADITDFSDADYATAAQGATADTALQNLLEDITPQLGGALDTNGNAITDSTMVEIQGTKYYEVTGQTTTAALTVLQALSVPIGARVTFTILGSATESATEDSFGFELKGCVKNVGGTVTLIGGTVLTEFKNAGATAWDITAVANSTTDSVDITATGEAAHTIDWNYSLQSKEV